MWWMQSLRMPIRNKLFLPKIPSSLDFLREVWMKQCVVLSGERSLKTSRDEECDDKL
jgi:hypothetical protein